jgi:hypothetical protein
VVNIVSKMQTVCAVLECFKDSGNVEEGGILGSTDGLSSQRAQFANVLHAWSIPSRYNDASALSVNYGFDQTDANEVIHKVVNPADLGLESLNVGLTRTGQSAVACVLTALTRRLQDGPNQGLVMETLFGVHEPWRSLPPLLLLFQGITKIEAWAELHVFSELARDPYSLEEATTLRDKLWETSQELISARALDKKSMPARKPMETPAQEEKVEAAKASAQKERSTPSRADEPSGDSASKEEDVVVAPPAEKETVGSRSAESTDETKSTKAEKKAKKQRKKTPKTDL